MQWRFGTCDALIRGRNRRRVLRRLSLATIEAGTMLDDTAFAVDVAGRLVPAELHARAFYDPAGTRMRTS